MNMRLNSAPIEWVRRRTGRALDDKVLDTLRSAAPGLARPETEDDRVVLESCALRLAELAEQRHELARLHSHGLDVIGRLSSYTVRDHELADDARRRLRELMLHAHRLAEATDAAAGIDASQPLADDVERDIGASPSRHKERGRYLASIVSGLVSAIAVVVLLVSGHPGLAAALFVTRAAFDVALAMLSGGPTDLVPVFPRRHSLSLRMRFFGGALGRFGEVTIWMGMAVVASTDGAHERSFIVAGLVAVALFTSLVRAGAGEAGIPAVRTRREEVVGALGIATGLVLVTASSPWAGALVAVGAAVSCSVFETVAVLRQVWQLQTTDVGLIMRGADDHGTLQTSFVHGPAPRRRH